MTTITMTYCYVCDQVQQVLNSVIGFCERVGTSRAAAELSRQGYHAEAKALMLSIGKETK